MSVNEMESAAIALAGGALSERHPSESGAKIVTVWQCKALQNWKFVLAAPSIGVLFEVTYNGDRREWYVDIYEKTDNVVFAEDVKPAFLHDGMATKIQQPSAAERKQRQ